MMTSSPAERVIFDALRSKYWEGKLTELENILKLERKWVRRPILIIKECELVKMQIFIQIKEWLFVLTLNPKPVNLKVMFPQVELFSSDFISCYTCTGEGA